MYAIGSTVRRVVRVYAADGVTLADADSTPSSGTLRVNGSDTAAVVSVTKRAATTGTYDVSCSLAGRALGDECLLTVEFVIGGVTVPWESDTFRVTLDSNNLVLSNLTRIVGETALPLNLVSLLNDYIQNPGLDANVIRWKGTNVAVGGPDNRPLVRVDQLANNTVTAASIAAEALNGKGDWALATYWTQTRAGYLDKLNVTGTLAHTDNADTFKADVSGLLTASGFASALPANFGDMAIDEGGLVLVNVLQLNSSTAGVGALGELGADYATEGTVPARGDWATDTQAATILDRIGAWTGSGINTILGAFKALLSKAASAPSDIGGTFDPATDSTEAIREQQDTLSTFDPSSDTVDLSATSQDALVAAIEAEIADDATGEAIKQAIVNKLLENLPDLDDLTLAAIATSVRDAILDRVLAVNHDTPGTPGKLLQEIAAKTTNLPASPAAVSDIPTASENATATAAAILETPENKLATDANGNAIVRTKYWGDNASPVHDGAIPNALAGDANGLPLKSDVAAVGESADSADQQATAAHNAIIGMQGEDGKALLSATTHTGAVVPSVTTVTGNVNGSVGSVVGAVGSVTSPVTAGTVSDKTGYALSASGLSAISTWTVDITGNVSGSVGSISGVTFPAGFSTLTVANIQSGLSTLDAAGVRSAIGLATNNLDTQLASLNVDVDEEAIATATAAAILETPENKLATDASGNAKVAFEEEDIDSIVDGVSAGLNIPTVDEIHSSLAGQPLYPVSRVTHGNIVVVRGDSYILADGTHLSLVEPANSGWPTDLTGWTLSFTADRHPSLSTGDASITATTAPTLSATTGTGRIIRVQLGTADTDGLATDSNGVLAYNFDVVATSSGKRVTLWRGAMSVLEERTAIA